MFIIVNINSHRHSKRGKKSERGNKDDIKSKDEKDDEKSENACEWCEYDGLTPKHLRYHIKSKHPEHHKDQRQCEICPHKTRSINDLEMHVKLNHPEHFFSKDKSPQHQQQQTPSKYVTAMALLYC